MKVILMQYIKGVGKKDTIINANDGYARNFLFPKKLAVEANKENLAKLKSKQNSEAHKKDLEKQKAEELKQKLFKIELRINVKAGENGKIFGSITSKEVSAELKKQYNIEIDKKKIILKEPIKELGAFTLDIKLYEGIMGKLKISILA